MLVFNECSHVKNINGAVILKPGINDIDPKVWDRVTTVSVDGKKKNHPSVQHWIDEGEIVVQDANDKMQDLSTLSVKKAVALVKKTLTLELLNLWAAEEERSGVVKALQEQLKLLEVKPTKSGEDDGE